MNSYQPTRAQEFRSFVYLCLLLAAMLCLAPLLLGCRAKAQSGTIMKRQGQIVEKPSYPLTQVYLADVLPGQTVSVLQNGMSYGSYISIGANLMFLGDSHPSGYGLRLPETQSFPSLISAVRGWNLTNYANGGDNFVDLYLRYPWGRNISLATVTALNEGTNDVTALCVLEGGACSALTTLHRAQLAAQLRAYIVYSGTLNSRKMGSQDATAAGTWLGSIGHPLEEFSNYSVSTGDTLTFSFYGTRGDLLTFAGHGTQGSFSVTLDGQTPVVCPWPNGTTTCSNYIDEQGINGGTFAVIDTPMRNLTLAWHTVRVTVTNGAGGISILGVVGSTASEPKPVVAVSYPSRFGTCAGIYPNHTDALVSSVWPTYATELATLLADGFNLAPVNYSVAGGPDATTWNPNDTSQTQPDCVHPGIAGTQRVAQAYLNALSGH